MKKLLFILVSIIAFSSCEKEGALTSSSAGNGGVLSTAAVLKYSGSFSPTAGESASGFARIYLEGTNYKLKLEDFSVSSGPDLKVYLSKTATPTDFVNLGSLPNNTVFDIPSGINLDEYKYALIHCQQYNHLFAIAPLTASN